MTDTPFSIAAIIEGADAMRELGAAIGGQLGPGDAVLLHGDLGAGKTTLMQGIASGLGLTEPVQSPTFTLRAEYPVTLATGEAVTLYHLDLYRLEEQAQLEDLGWGDLITAEHDVLVVEWPERAGEWLPQCYLLVLIVVAGPGARHVTIREVA